MAMSLQLVVYSAIAPAITDSWAAALEYEVEDPSQVIEPNRLHIDAPAEPGGLDALMALLERLRATRVREVDQGPVGPWWVMHDPEGNEFCAA